MQLFLLLFVPHIIMSYFFRAQGRSQIDLVNKLARQAIVSSPEVRQAMSAVRPGNV